MERDYLKEQILEKILKVEVVQVQRSRDHLGNVWILSNTQIKVSALKYALTKLNNFYY